LRRRAARHRTLCATLRAAALARFQAQFQIPARHRGVCAVHAPRGSLLDRDAVFPNEEFWPELDGFHHADRVDRPVALVFPDATGAAAAGAAQRSSPGGGIGTWQRITRILRKVAPATRPATSTSGPWQNSRSRSWGS